MTTDLDYDIYNDDINYFLE